MPESETKKKDHREDDAEPLSGNGLVDEMSEESFPASDPPATTSAHAGTPRPVGEDRRAGTKHEPR